MTQIEYEIFLRERTLSWVRKEIRKHKRSIYLEREDKAVCDGFIMQWNGMVRRIEEELQNLRDRMEDDNGESSSL